VNVSRALGGGLAAAGLLAIALAGCGGAGADAPATEQWRTIDVEARAAELVPEHPGPRRVGALVFRGGVELSSRDAAFGGISGLWIGADGRFVAVNDHGWWICAQLESDAESGAPLRLANVRAARMRNERGKYFHRRSFADAEGLARLPDGRFAVSFEQRQLLRFYDLDAAGPSAAPRMGPSLGGGDDLEANAGLEAVADAGGGRLLIGAERSEPGAEQVGAALWLAPIDASGGDISPAAHLDTPKGFGLTSLDRLPDGDFVVLERFYAPVVGPRVRILRLAASSLGAGHASATLLADLGREYAIDNFESVAVLPLSDGGARLFLISDDNFSPTQRTLLYVFDLPASLHRN
jgi:hypothetical protein